MLLSKLAIALIAPLGTAFAAGGPGLALALLGRRKLAFGLTVAAFGWLWLWSTPAASTWVRLSVESEFPPRLLASLPTAPAAVVLGGGMSPPSAARPFPDLHEASDRVWHAARLYHASKAPLLVLSGGSDPDVSPTSEAQAMLMLLSDLGVPDSAMVLEGASRNTRENAALTAALLKAHDVRHVLLVTSAMHMARAVAAFEAEGIKVVPVAIDHTEPKPLSVLTAWLPDSSSLTAAAKRSRRLWGGESASGCDERRGLRDQRRAVVRSADAQLEPRARSPATRPFNLAGCGDSSRRGSLSSILTKQILRR